MTTTAKLRRGGLDWNVPQDGKAADAYAVASTTIVLMQRYVLTGPPDVGLKAARHATRLHVISGLLSILATNKANGYRMESARVRDERRRGSFEADAQEIAQHYGLTCYFQGDPRGCSLYIGEAETLKASYTRGHAIVRLGR